jgi:riboflavin kinase/FMN adenylyltransferase
MRVACVGVFDGVHIGHQALLGETNRVAKKTGLSPIALTFDPHPAKVLKPEATLWQLTTIEQRIRLLLETKLIDSVEVVNFTLAMATTSAQDFIDVILKQEYKIAHVVVGENFNFGKDREGNVEMLRANGIEVTEAPLYEYEDSAVSSTRIRRLLIEGNIELANKLLTRKHMVQGIVEHGDKRGRELGFPTANTAIVESLCLPDDGVYKGYVEVEGYDKTYKSAISLGRRPTFYEERGLRLLEPYLLDFDADIYGKTVKIHFELKIRDQIKFDSMEQLIAQITADVELCK